MYFHKLLIYRWLCNTHGCCDRLLIKITEQTRFKTYISEIFLVKPELRNLFWRVAEMKGNLEKAINRHYLGSNKNAGISAKKKFKMSITVCLEDQFVSMWVCSDKIRINTK